MSTETIRIMTWNVQCFNSQTEQLGTEIKRQQPHIVILQETMMWIENDKHLNWTGATILNMESIQQTRGKRGGLAVIIAPGVEFTELYRTAIGVDFDELKGPALPPEHVETINIFNTEDRLPDGVHDVSQRLELDTIPPTNSTPDQPLSTQRPALTKATRRGGRRKKKRPGKADQEKPREQDFIQSISLRLTNDLVVTGSYIGPQTKKETTAQFFADTLNRYGINQVIVGDFNARHHNWDTTSNDRGAAVMELVNKTPGARVVAAPEPSYFKTIRSPKGGYISPQSNPDIAIVNTHETTAYINARDWSGVSDHRPVTFSIKRRLKLKDTTRRVAKSLFFSKTASKEAREHYADGIENIIEKLDNVKNGSDEATTQAVYKEMESFITQPWERIVRRRPPRKPLWWNRQIGTAQQKRRYLARKWHTSRKESERWKDRDLCDRTEQLHVQLIEQQRQTRRLSRRAQALLQTRTKTLLKEAGLTDQSKAINKDRRGKAMRQAEAIRTGKQLISADFTRYMGEQQYRHPPIQPRQFGVDNRKFRRRMRRAINAMHRNRAVGVDNVHSEMMQTAPNIFARLLTKAWEAVGRSTIIPVSWTEGVMVPLLKKGAQDKPDSYRPLCMLSHVRKAIERAVVDELDELVQTDRMQFGFQRAINTLQAAIDVAAVLQETVDHLVAVLDLTKAYDRVVRKIIIEKLEKLNVPRDLINQVIVFLVPLLVKTAGDVTNTVATLTTGLTQGGSASPALFRIFINDLAKELREAAGQSAEGEKDSLCDPAKLVADDVIILAKDETTLQTLLNTCTNWAARNELEWKPQKCSVVTRNFQEERSSTFLLAGQEIPQHEEARYLGITVSSSGFKKRVDAELVKRCFSACTAVTRQPFFSADLPNSTLRALYRTNVRSILTYGLMLTADTEAVERLDRRLLNCFFKPIVQHSRELSARLTDRLCLRIRLPSLAMDVECGTKNWIGRLRSLARKEPNKKVRRHAEDTLKAIQKMEDKTILRKHYTLRGGTKDRILLSAFKKWNSELAPAKRTSRAVDKVSKLTITRDILDSPCLSAPEKCSAYRYLVYRFPNNAKLSKEEQQSLRLLLKQDLSKAERFEVTRTLKSVHARDERLRKEKEAANALLKLQAQSVQPGSK